MTTSAAAMVWMLTMPAAAATVLATLDPAAVGEAIALGQSSGDRERARFHATYRLVVNKAPVDYVEVITPFRRIVLAAQSRAQAGNRLFGQRQAFDILAAAPPTVELVVELTFHPLNTFVGVPDYSVVLLERGVPPIRPRGIDRIPRHGPRIEGAPLPDPTSVQLPGRNMPLVGGTLIARFDAQLLSPSGLYEVVIEEAGKELGRVRADLSRLR
jgi:hypothetical protein